MKSKCFVLFTSIMLITLMLGACAPTSPATSVSTEENLTVATESVTDATDSTTVEPVAQTETTATEGGTVTLAITADPDTLDIQKANTGAYIGAYIYSSLIAKDTEGNYLPYMADSWDISSDSLVYTFHLKQGVKFHNGDPVTAQDWVYTFNRAVDPETASPLTAASLAKMESIEAVDDYTLKITLTEPYYYFFDSLQYEGVMGVLSERAVEQYGDDYGRHPVGTGPFLFKEWQTGDRIVLERNPDFTWGPSYTNGVPPQIQTLVFRIIPETSTIVAGLEAGEIDWAGNFALSSIDVNNLKTTGMFDVVSFPAYAVMPYVVMNLNKAPFDDIRVRQALNYAVDRQAMIDIVVPDSGATPAYGPLSPSMEGYSAEVEKIGYGYDLEKAKQLMMDAGYTYNTDGMLEKDGQPFSINMITLNGLSIDNKADEVLQAQWLQLGVDVKLQLTDMGVAIQNVISGDYEISDMGWGYANSELLDILYNSKNIGTNNYPQVNDPELDEILNNMVTVLDKDEHLRYAAEAQKRIIEQAYIIPLFDQTQAEVISKKLQGYVYIKSDMGFRLWDASIEE